MTQGIAAKLAQFFPEAAPVRMPVEISRCEESRGGAEATTIEFGTTKEVIFLSRQNLEFGEKISIQNADRTIAAEAAVVAVQWYQTEHGMRTAVAARFTREVQNWVVKA